MVTELVVPESLAAFALDVYTLANIFTQQA